MREPTSQQLVDDLGRAERELQRCRHSPRSEFQEKLDARDAAQGKVLARMTEGWQPIATAPKDGTFVDLWFPGNGSTVQSKRITNCRWMQVRRWSDNPHGLFPTGIFDWFAQAGGMADRKTEYRMDNPTHWQPLPSPPSDPAP